MRFGPPSLCVSPNQGHAEKAPNPHYRTSNELLKEDHGGSKICAELESTGGTSGKRRCCWEFDDKTATYAGSGGRY